jgi:pyruvate/2-oxoglutarate dehydrogenase complex dihydrolipoamide acyltransferase (E2) component
MVINTACRRCERIFEAHSFKAVYCGAGCRNAAYRERKRAAQAEASRAVEAETVQSPPADPTTPPTSMAARTLAELQAANVDGTALGSGRDRAGRADRRVLCVDTPSGLVALVKEHAAAMTRALGGLVVDSLDPFDELARRREERRKASGG